MRFGGRTGYLDRIDLYTGGLIELAQLLPENTDGGVR